MQIRRHIQDIWLQVFPPPPFDMRDDLPVPPLPRGGPAQTKAALDAYLDVLLADIANYAPAAVPSLIVTGAMRCGKTLVARRVARRNGMYHVPGDRLRKATFRNSDEATKQRVIKYISKRLLLAHPTGLVLDSTIFLDRGVTVPHWASTRGIPCVAIGYAQDNPARKAQSMIAFRKTAKCWTSRSKSDADMHKLARQIIWRSKEIKAVCATQGWPYFDLEAAAFSREKRRVVYAIETLLHHGRTAP
ncbi:hypothetical protein [Roseinatronobacter sp. NSM]|uniref:hypothetical protein n=1 Tax=Roseinatronobacter sp. NSM TaxID=3457785 RepID=UPI0040369368